jgi:hypothetical protein
MFNFKSLAAGLCLVAAHASVSAADATPTRVTPFLKVAKVDEGGNKVYVDAYTRLDIQAAMPDGDTKISYRKRKLLWRLAIGQKYTFGTMLKIDAGRFADTVPLFSRDYESSRKVGETFSRSIGFDRMAFPWFLASAGSGSRTTAFTLTANMTETTNSEVSSLALGSLRTALKAVAPSSTVLTTLTKESADKVASKIDEQASKLFGTSVAEEVRFDLDLADNKAYRIELYGPELETDELMERAHPLLGSWVVKMAPPRPSIFFTEPCADATCTAAAKNAYDHATANPAAVLAFKLVEQVGEIGTIRAYLTQQPWWGSALDEFKTIKSTDFGGFCRKIRGAVAELGLNDLDGRIIANAVAKSGLVATPLANSMAGSADCKR